MLPIIAYKSVGDVANGIAITEDGTEYYSATALSRLGGVYPTSRAGIYKMAEREGWQFINLPGKGAKDGVKYFRLPSKPKKNDIDIFGALSLGMKKTDQKPAAYGLSTPDNKNVVDTICIEHYASVKGSAGPGQVTPTDQTIIQVAINASEWRNYVGLDHKHVKIITIHGDSMRPTFCHGDQVLVDTACHSFIDDGVYAIQQGDLLRVKRIKLKLDGSIEVKSDNTQGFSTDVHTKEEAADFKIYGRVIPFKFGKIEL